LDFILAQSGHNTPEWFVWRKTLMADVARYNSLPLILPISCSGVTTLISCSFLAVSWKSPQQVDPAYRNHLRQGYVKELGLLLSSLPARFHPAIQSCINSMDDILSLPMVLLHQDFGWSNIMVDEASCHLVGVIDWAEAEICPFGLNLSILESITGRLHLKNGWSRYEDYNILQDTLWNTFKQEVGGLTGDTVCTIKSARIMGLLLCYGFTSRLAHMPEPVPIGNDEVGRYNTLSLDGFLLNPATRLDSLN
jgi:hypothetical protein